MLNQQASTGGGGSPREKQGGFDMKMGERVERQKAPRTRGGKGGCGGGGGGGKPITAKVGLGVVVSKVVSLIYSFGERCEIKQSKL